MRELLVYLIAGLGVFFIGCKMLSDNMERLANSSIRVWFNKTSNNKFIALGVGVLTTAVVQSSGITSVMAVGMVNAGVMSLYQAVVILLGANIGTTVTAQIANLSNTSVSIYLLVLVGIGVLINFISKKERVKQVANIISGLGLIFIGLEYMKNAFVDIAEVPFIYNFLTNTSNPFLLLLFGIIVTALSQSSSTTTAVLVVLGASGIVIGGGGNAVLYIVLGANLGSSITAILSSIGANINAKRLGFIHFFFKLIGVTLFTVMLMIWSDFAEVTFAKWFTDAGTEIAMFHTSYNLLASLIFMWCVRPMIKLAEIVFKDKGAKKEEQTFLDKRFLASSELAIMQTKLECVKLIDMSLNSVDIAVKAFISKDDSDLNKLNGINEEVLSVSRNVTDYLIRISATDSGLSQEKQVAAMHDNNGDIIRVSELALNVSRYTRKEIDNNLEFSEPVKVSLDDMLQLIQNIGHLAKEILRTGNKELLATADEVEGKIDALRKSLLADHIARLNDGTCKPENSSVFINLVSNLERIGDHLHYVCHSFDNI